MNPQADEMDTIMSKEILAKELHEKLFPQVIKLCVILISCRVLLISTMLCVHIVDLDLSAPPHQTTVLNSVWFRFIFHFLCQLVLACSLYLLSNSMAQYIYFSFQHLRLRYSAKEVLIPGQVHVSVILPVGVLGSRLNLLTTQDPSYALQNFHGS